jgi:hypothetical protein
LKTDHGGFLLVVQQARHHQPQQFVEVLLIEPMRLRLSYEFFIDVEDRSPLQSSMVAKGNRCLSHPAYSGEPSMRSADAGRGRRTLLFHRCRIFWRNIERLLSHYLMNFFWSLSTLLQR